MAPGCWRWVGEHPASVIAPAIVPGANYPAVMRNRPSMLFALLACLLLVLLGLAMVIAGWSGQTVTQRLLLDLAQLPIVAAVLVGVVSMVGSRRLWRRRAFTTTFAGAGLILLVGVCCWWSGTPWIARACRWPR